MSAFQSSIVYSLILAVVGYAIMATANSFGLSPEVTFAAGLLIGSLFIAIVTNTPSSKTPSSTSSSTPATSAPAATKTASTSAATATSDNDKGGPTKTIYVGNLPYRANEAVIKELFEKFGYVHSVRLLKDRQTGKRRGFGFVEMAEATASTAIEALNESEFQQRTLKVREAKDRPEKVEDEAFQEQV